MNGRNSQSPLSHDVSGFSQTSNHLVPSKSKVPCGIGPSNKGTGGVYTACRGTAGYHGPAPASARLTPGARDRQEGSIYSSAPLSGLGVRGAPHFRSSGRTHDWVS